MTNSISFESLLPFALFGLVAAAVWWVLEFFADRNSRASSRLDEIREPNRRRQRAAQAAGRSDRVTKVLEKATPALARPLTPTNELDASHLKVKLANGGFRGETAASIFLGLKFAGLIFGLVCGSGAMLAAYGMTQKALAYSVLVAGGCFYLPDVVLYLIRRQRQQNIFLGLPDALDLLVVCVEAGLGLDQAMRKVSEEMKRSHPVVGEEFGIANMQVQMGRNRADVLHELGIRSGVDDMRSLAAILIQAEKLGSSVAQALRVQSDSMRTRRRQLAEEKAAKTAVKLIFPLVIFIFPGIFVVLVGPAAITMMRDMFPAMGGGG
jgi:tight adherence protein C